MQNPKIEKKDPGSLRENICHLLFIFSIIGDHLVLYLVFKYQDGYHVTFCIEIGIYAWDKGGDKALWPKVILVHWLVQVVYLLLSDLCQKIRLEIYGRHMIMTEGDVQGVLYLCMMMLLYVILYFECLFVSSVCLLGCVFFLYWIIQIQYIWMETNLYADYTADEDINLDKKVVWQSSFP